MSDREVRQPTLETERLVLRPFEPDDAPEVQRLAGARAVADTTLVIPYPYPPNAAVEWIATLAPRFAAGTLVSFAITQRSEASLVGAIGLHIVSEHRRAELGYWIGVPFWGRGFATEAGRAMLEFGFRRLGLHRIHANHLTRNPASGRVLQKLGLRLEGVHREAIRKWDTFEDVAAYGILITDEPGWRD